jgi:hypothetical protein
VTDNRIDADTACTTLSCLPVPSWHAPLGYSPPCQAGNPNLTNKQVKQERVASAVCRYLVYTHGGGQQYSSTASSWRGAAALPPGCRCCSRLGRRAGQHLQGHFLQAGHLLPLLHQGEAGGGAAVDLVGARVAAEDGAPRRALEVLQEAQCGQSGAGRARLRRDGAGWLRGRVLRGEAAVQWGASAAAPDGLAKGGSEILVYSTARWACQAGAGTVPPPSPLARLTFT